MFAFFFFGWRFALGTASIFCDSGSDGAAALEYEELPGADVCLRELNDDINSIA